MSISAISPLSRYVAPNPVIVDPRLQTNEGESCWTTAMKIAAMITAVIASIAGFVFLGPLIGLVVTLILGTGALLIFNSCFANSHDHPRRDGASLNTPWYQRVFPFIVPTGGAHVPIRGPHVPVGQGHTPARPWYESLFSYIPSGIRHMNEDDHVPVGRGHGRGGHIPVGRGHGPASDPHHAHGRGRAGPTHIPPPSGPTGHVPIDRRH
jgi:hypothetical protein